MGASPSTYFVDGSCESIDATTNLSAVGAKCCAAAPFAVEQLMMMPAQEFRSYSYLFANMILLVYCFGGVSLGANVFMSAIEVITSKEKTKMETHPKTGVKRKIHYRVWNPTVANLTLMALGSSAPEILLSVIEVVLGSGDAFMQSGDLGPSTIVGSAAFNLMVITAVCITAMPDGEVRRIKQLGVFLTTAFFSIFAYVWLLIMVVFVTPGVITVAEGVLTNVFMVLLVVLSYGADKYWDRMTHSYSELDAKTTAKALAEAGLSLDDHPDAIASAMRGHDDLARQMSGVMSSRLINTKAFYTRQLLGMPEPLIAPRSSISGPGAATKGPAKVAPTAAAPGLAAAQRQQQQSAVASAEIQSRMVEAGMIQFETHDVRVPENCGTLTVKVNRLLGHKGAVSVRYTTKDQTAIAPKDYLATTGILQWADGDARVQEVKLTINDDDQYEKCEEFTLVLMDPKGGCVFNEETDGREDEEICTISILNDDDAPRKLANFKSAIRLLGMDSDEVVVTADHWKEACRHVFTLPEGGVLVKTAHVLTMPWMFLFNVLIPPPGLLSGWPCFFGALIGIALQVILIAAFATQMGCHMGLPPGINAIIFVALGTSLPDTFASRQAALGEKYADGSIGNVTGSNSVNVFLGLGLPWLIGSAYWTAKGEPEGFKVSATGLGVSVLTFILCALGTICLILFRRFYLKAELGGRKRTAYMHAAFLVSLWLLYIIISILHEPMYGPIIEPFM